MPLYWSCLAMSHLLPDGRWASVPLCAAVIWLITSICSSRRAASSSLSAVWVPSVSSREAARVGKWHPSVSGCGILPVPYPCWEAGPKTKSSCSVKSWSLKSWGWAGWAFQGWCLAARIFSAGCGCPFFSCQIGTLILLENGWRQGQSA